MSEAYRPSLAFPALCGLLALRPTTLSQAMHNAGFEALDLPFHYSAFDVEDTAAGLQAMRVLGVRGLSLTIPHKENAMALVDSVSEEGRQIGAINTVINDGCSLSGDNTDWFGIEAALKEAGIDAAGGKVMIVGAGGAARAGVYAAKHLGAGEVYVYNRTAARAAEVAGDFGVATADQSDIDALAQGGFRLVINATPIGSALQPEGQHPFSLENWPKETAVLDMVTKETAFTKAAKQSGAAVAEGPRMLLYQAVRQFELFTGKAAPVEAMEAALVKQLS